MRQATIVRTTNETSIELTLGIDGSGQAQINTGIGFYDHMLTLFAGHGLFDLRVEARGDLHVDEHHTAEDVAICLGKALDQALGDRAGIVRTAHSYVPMDEALGFVAVDLGGRIRINAIEPAAIETDMLKAGFATQPHLLEQLKSAHPSGRIGNPDEVARAALQLANPENGFLQGACILLDGGIGSRLHDPN